MKIKDGIAVVGVILVGVLSVLIGALQLYRMVHPIPDLQRAFVPEFECSFNGYAEACTKHTPH